MALCITRFQTDVTPPVITTFPARYKDRDQAEWGLKSILTTYWQSGKDKEEGVWWAREKDGQTFTFLIACVTAPAGSASRCGGPRRK